MHGNNYRARGAKTLEVILRYLAEMDQSRIVLLAIALCEHSNDDLLNYMTEQSAPFVAAMSTPLLVNLMLHSAIENRQWEIFLELLERGADIEGSFQGTRHLQAATHVYDWDERFFNELVERGASLTTKNRAGFSILHELLPFPTSCDAMRLILEKEPSLADETSPDRSHSILEIAVATGCPETLSIILEFGGVVRDGNFLRCCELMDMTGKNLITLLKHSEFSNEAKRSDFLGKTLILACMVGDNIAVIESLLENGANPNFMDSTGGPPLSCIMTRAPDENIGNFSKDQFRDKRKRKIRQVLIKHGASRENTPLFYVEAVAIPIIGITGIYLVNNTSIFV